jgi:hypothetical protein
MIYENERYYCEICGAEMKFKGCEENDTQTTKVIYECECCHNEYIEESDII